MPGFAAEDGRRLHYIDEGSGPPVLCLAGLSRNHRDFDALAARLTGRFRVIRLDSRGRGGSDRAADPMAEYQPAVEAGDALALLDRLGLSGVGVVGTSRGGVLGMVMAASRPGSVAALALNDIGATIETAGLRRVLGYLGLPPEGASVAEAAAALEAANADRFPGVPRARWEAHARALYDVVAGRPVLSYDPALREVTEAGLEGAGETLDLRPLFGSIGPLPVLVLRGANSDILEAGTVAEMAAQHPGLSAVEVADRGHAPFLDEPEAAAAVEAFLTRTLSP